MQLIIVGAGGIGQALVGIALKEKHDIIVIEKDPHRCDEVTRKYDVIAINADATLKGTLAEAGIEDADGLVSTVDDDSINLMVVSLARNMGVENLVSVVNQPESQPIFYEKNVSVVGDPDKIMAEYLYKALRRPTMEDFMHIGENAEIFKVSLCKESLLCGKTLKKSHLPDKVLVVAIERKGKLIIPTGSTKLVADDLLTVLAVTGKIDRAIKLISGTGLQRCAHNIDSKPNATAASDSADMKVINDDSDAANRS